MAAKILRYAFFAVLAFVGYQWGLATAPASDQALDLSSETTEPTSLNDFAALPCPSEADFLRMAADVHLLVPEGPSIDQACDQSPRALLGKSLLLMTSLKLKIPQDWPEPLRSDLLSPFDFLKKNVSKLSLDLTQKDSIAYNKVSVREIYLGGRFFTTEPLGAVAILVHEARHSVRTAPGHEFCLSGDIPRTAGACDAEFSLEDSKNGAYGYGTLFSIAVALYGDNVSKADREYMLIDALVQLGARFNKIPDALARKVDVLAVLGHDQRIYLVHPFLHYARPLNLAFAASDERPVRIEFAPLHNGLLIYTSRGRVWQWSSLKGLLPLYEKLLTPDMPVADIARLRVPFLEQTSYVIREPNGTLKFIEYSPERNERVLSPYPVHFPRTNGPAPDIQLMALAMYNDSVFLDKAGALYLAPHFGNEFAFTKVPQLQSSRGWTSLNGGIIYESLNLIDRSGQNHWASMNIVDDATGGDDAAFSRQYQQSVSVLQTQAPMKKFMEGLRIRSALDNQGRLSVWKDEGAAKILNLDFPVKDFVMMQNAETREPIGRTSQEPDQFQKQCGVKRLLRDPWLGRGIGVDHDNRIVMAGGRDGECVRMTEQELRSKTPYFD